MWSKGNKVLPPFGRVLLAYQQEKIRLNHSIDIYVGKEAEVCAFSAKCSGWLCTFLPYDQDFTQYDWPIKNQKIIIEDTGGMTLSDLKKFSVHLLTFDPRVIILFSEDHRLMELILPKGRNYNG